MKTLAILADIMGLFFVAYLLSTVDHLNIRPTEVFILLALILAPIINLRALTMKPNTPDGSKPLSKSIWSRTLARVATKRQKQALLSAVFILPVALYMHDTEYVGHTSPTTVVAIMFFVFAVVSAFTPLIEWASDSHNANN